MSKARKHPISTYDLEYEKNKPKKEGETEAAEPRKETRQEQAGPPVYERYDAWRWKNRHPNIAMAFAVAAVPAVFVAGLAATVAAVAFVPVVGEIFILPGFVAMAALPWAAFDKIKPDPWNYCETKSPGKNPAKHHHFFKRRHRTP